MRAEYHQEIACRIFRDGPEQAGYPKLVRARLQRYINNDQEGQKVCKTMSIGVSRQTKDSGGLVPYNKDTAGNTISTVLSRV